MRPNTLAEKKTHNFPSPANSLMQFLLYVACSNFKQDAEHSFRKRDCNTLMTFTFCSWIETKSRALEYVHHSFSHPTLVDLAITCITWSARPPSDEIGLSS